LYPSKINNTRASNNNFRENEWLEAVGGQAWDSWEWAQAASILTNLLDNSKEALYFFLEATKGATSICTEHPDNLITIKLISPSKERICRAISREEIQEKLLEIIR
jgi:hypothetical protein